MKAIMRDEREMKDSGIEWIGQLPMEWKVMTIKYTSLLKGRIGWQGLKSTEFVDNGPYLITGTDFKNGIVNWETCAHITDDRFIEDEDIHIIEDDLLITKDGTIGKVAIAKNCPEKVSLNSGVLLIRNDKIKYIDKYLYYTLLSEEFILWYELNQPQNSTIRHLYQGQFYNFKFAFPPYDEQQAIANYLDDRCSKIDAIIAEAKASIEEYKELKQAVIYEAVTKGLDKNVPFKDSGVEWIGKYPSNWKLTHLGKIAEIGAGGTPDRKEPSYWNGDIPWMASGEVNLEYVYDTKEKISKEGLKNSSAKLLPTNTVMLGLIGQGKTKGLAAILKTPCCCNQNLAYLISSKKWLHYRYLYYSFKAMYLYLRGIIGESQAGIYQGTIKQLYITLPSVEEQIVISDYLDGYVCKMDTIISEKQSLIADLEAYKKSLIYEVVTGKRKVVA